jgi:hypothetical protein
MDEMIDARLGGGGIGRRPVAPFLIGGGGQRRRAPTDGRPDRGARLWFGSGALTRGPRLAVGERVRHRARVGRPGETRSGPSPYEQ